MNNLKRIFSLGLATVMVIGMMVTGASAAFTDVETIDKTDAANTVVALGIISGIPAADGTLSFNPKGDVTRAQMATMITMALTGGKDFRGSSVTGFPDVDGTASAWAGKFIKYCIDKEIISGKVPGKVFDPEGKVTAQEASAMILLAMGFKKAQLAAPAGSADWAVTINDRAEKSGLYDDTDVVDYSEAINRENAAQMIYNGITAGTPVWTEEYDSEKGTTYKMTGTNGPSMLKTIFKANVEYATLVSSSYDPATKVFTYTLDSTATGLVDPLGGAAAAANLQMASKTDYSDLFMQKVQVIYSGTTVSTNATVIGITPAHQNVIGSGVWGTMKVVAGTKHTIDGLSVDGGDETAIPVYPFNGAQNGTVGTNTATPIPGTAPAKYATYTLIDNTGDNKVDVVVTNTPTVAAVSGVAKDGKVTVPGVNGGAAIDPTKHNVAEGLKRNQIVAATTAVNGTITIEAVEVLVNAAWTQTNSDSTYVIGGKTLGDAATHMSGKTLGNKYDVAVLNGYIVNVGAPTTPSTAPSEISNVVYALQAANVVENAVDFGTSTYSGKVQILKQDNSKETITVGSVEGTALAVGAKDSPAVATDALYIMTTDEDGVIDLTAVTAAGVDLNADAVNANDSVGSGKVGTYRIDDDAVIFAKIGSTTKCVDGKTVGGWKIATSANNFNATNSALYTSEAADGFTYVNLGILIAGADLSTWPGTISDAEFGYVIADATTVYLTKGDRGVASTGTYYTLKVWNGTEEKEYVTSTDITAWARKGAFAEYKTSTGDTLASVAQVNLTNDAIVAWDGTEFLTEDGTSAKAAAETTKIFFVDSANKTGVAEGSIMRADPDLVTSADWIENVATGTDSTSTLTILVVDINNKI